MKWKLLLVLLLGLLFLIPKSSSPAMEHTYVWLDTGWSVGLGVNEPDAYVVVEETSGTLNSTMSVLDAGSLSGSWTFCSNVSGIIEVTDPGKDYDIRASGAFTKDEVTGYVTKPFVVNEQVTIFWEIPLEPLLPFGFIMGMVGLGSMFGGSLWMIKKLKEHEFIDAITEGFVISIVGAALLISWLWA